MSATFRDMVEKTYHSYTKYPNMEALPTSCGDSGSSKYASSKYSSNRDDKYGSESKYSSRDTNYGSERERTSSKYSSSRDDKYGSSKYGSESYKSGSSRDDKYGDNSENSARRDLPERSYTTSSTLRSQRDFLEAHSYSDGLYAADSTSKDRSSYFTRDPSTTSSRTYTTSSSLTNRRDFLEAEAYSDSYTAASSTLGPSSSYATQSSSRSRRFPID
ncbi:hypothetical protein H2200_011000 [Cladophialophora chaetospira]|uniref:Uncharacterized protein n=1 Tax=Cladophialophora chaetospira TaxID=386627 RepID=A0AA38WZT5_9EURO|nr:hypothetical protein H2200_011000 [Cladophialophora chaetospira]